MSTKSANRGKSSSLLSTTTTTTTPQTGAIEAMAGNNLNLLFPNMGEAGLRQWVESNRGRVNDRDSGGWTPLIVAAGFFKSVPLIKWLVKDKGAELSAADQDGLTPLHIAESFEVLKALLDCGADPTLEIEDGMNALMHHLACGHHTVAARLLQDPRVHASVNMQDSYGRTALHLVSLDIVCRDAPAVVQLLLQAGADLTLTNRHGETPLNVLQHVHPTHPTTLTLLEQSLDARRASFLVKARRLVMASTMTPPPSFLRERVARGMPFPDVALASVTEGQNDDELRTMLAWLVGMESGGMPRDVFRVVLDLVMPFWDPLRRQARGGGGGGGRGQPRLR